MILTGPRLPGGDFGRALCDAFPALTWDERFDIAWTHTGYPSFFWCEPGEEPIDVFRRQLDNFKAGQCVCLDCAGEPGEIREAATP